ncbi:hypothetical protein FAGAP_3014 [Fusarium agapanthi]|uniref:Uncharacterized protein n=1 Tax=Fusarium agapanthi TaxID=1803897 RepID=A0A9P5BEE9_9HYPO|nr:hypothetical protein FAGAP_3014 [Fusarium agapanthi]
MKRWLATHTPAKASLSASEYSLRELGAAIGIDFNIISQQHLEVIRKKMLSCLENIVTCLNLPERFDTASGELRTVWPEGVAPHTHPAPPPSQCPKTMNLLNTLLKEGDPINIEMARITWKYLQEVHGQLRASLISSLRDFQASAFKDPEHQRIGNHFGNILQCLHDELGIPPTPVQAHPDVEMETSQDIGDDPRFAEMMDRFAKMESSAQETEETQRKALETSIGSLETVLGKTSENMHVPTPQPAAETKPAVEAKSGGTVAVVHHEPQLKSTPLLFQDLPHPAQYFPHGASRHMHARTAHTPIPSPTLTLRVPDDTSDSEDDEPERAGTSGQPSPPSSRGYDQFFGPSSVERHSKLLGAGVHPNYKVVHDWVHGTRSPCSSSVQGQRRLGSMKDGVEACVYDDPGYEVKDDWVHRTPSPCPTPRPRPRPRTQIERQPRHTPAIAQAPNPADELGLRRENLLILTNLVYQERKLRLDLIMTRIR